MHISKYRWRCFLVIASMVVGSGATYAENAASVDSDSKRTKAKTQCIDLDWHAAHSSSPTLINLATSFRQQGFEDEAAFLQVAAQIRSNTDLLLLEPVDEEEKAKAKEVYTAMSTKHGTLRPRTYLRESENVDRLLVSLREWQPTYNSNYDPGWVDTKSTNAGDYIEVFDYQRKIRIEKLRWDAQLLGDNT